MSEREAWPELRFEEWAATKASLQMCLQMLGKTRLALAPPLPEWLHSCLYLDPRGFTTGPMPVGDGRMLTGRFDIFDSCIELDLSDGRREAVQVGPGKCVSAIWEEYRSALARLGVGADIWEKPQEVLDLTPFSANDHACGYDAAQAQRFHRVLTSVSAVFEEFRSRFFGRTGVQFWWGAFDLAVLLFNGRKSVAPDDRGYIMRYDLDAEHFNAGFWPGDENSPSPNFYAYLVPQPPGCDVASIAPEHAGWVETMGEWVMSYDAVRTCDDPAGAVRRFLESVYAFATTLDGWDAEAHSYVTPAPAPRD